MTFCADEGFPGEHGTNCHVACLEQSMESSNGRLLNRVITLNFALKEGFQVRMEDVPDEEFQALRILKSEYNKYEHEKSERDKHHGTDANRH